VREELRARAEAKFKVAGDDPLDTVFGQQEIASVDDDGAVPDGR
jgi:hypothetical protein